MIKRARLYLTRKYKRSILLLLLLFVVSFSISVGLSVWHSINSVTKEIEQRLGTSINFRVAPEILRTEGHSISVETSDGGSWHAYNGPKLNVELVERMLEELDGVSDYNTEDFKYVYTDNLSLVPGQWQLGDPYDDDDPFRQVQLMRARVTNIYANRDSSLYDKFRTGAFELIEGRHIAPEDSGTALISDELAKLNQVGIGDTIQLSVRAGMSGFEDPWDVWGDVVEAEIVGIFHVNGYQPVGNWVYEDTITYNWIFTDLQTARNVQYAQDRGFYKDYLEDVRYENVTFFVDDPAQLDGLLTQIENLDFIDPLSYDIAIDDTMYRSTVEPLNDIRNLIVGAVAVIVAGCAIVLCIIFTMWVRSRRQEIAVYLSMGLSKASILGQFILEAALVALVAGVLSFAVCQQVPGLIGNRMLADSIAAAQPEEREVSREEIHQTIQANAGNLGDLFAYESSEYAGPEHIDFTFRVTDFALLLLLELLIITAAICKAGWFIFELQPRRILTDLR